MHVQEIRAGAKIVGHTPRPQNAHERHICEAMNGGSVGAIFAAVDAWITNVVGKNNIRLHGLRGRAYEILSENLSRKCSPESTCLEIRNMLVECDLDPL